jgi:two-component system heavy metal sensor histidine kinase CusS
VRLSDLIGDLLFLARAESPLPHLRCERVDVGDLLDRVRDYYEASAADSGVSLNTLVAAEPVVAELDRALLQRAVGNLVSNALANTPAGGAVVLEACADSSTIQIRISDTGVGIPADALPRVFDRFFRVDSSRSQGSGGTGLGLAIVKSIVELHGGRVEISSQSGHGTQVTLHIPILSGA